MNKIPAMLFAAIIILASPNQLTAVLRLPPVKPVPQKKENQTLWQEAFFTALKLKNIVKIELMLQEDKALANSTCCFYFDRKLRTKRYTSPLFYALTHGLFDIAQLLITYGGDIDWKDQDGNFLLDIVLQEHRSEMIALLTRYGAKITPR